MRKYTIISPVRNEEDYLERTIRSVVSQTVQPLEWIIIDDGSTDKTPEIINKYRKKHSWIKTYQRKPGKYYPGAGVVQAFYEGFNKIENKDWEYVVKLDGDLEFKADYFEKLFERFEANPKLGMASGKTFVPENGKLTMEPCTDDHVRGPSKVYKRQCFEEIGGLPETLGWDTIDELKAQLKGWETRSYKDLVILHLRRMSYQHKDWSRGRLKFGRGSYFLGYHPLFILAKGFYRIFDKPYFIGGIAVILGYFDSMIKREPQYPEKEVIKHLRKKQLKRLFSVG